MRSYLISICLIFQLSALNADVRLYLQRDEVHKLLGLDVELYYIKDRKVNDYALKFVVPVPPTISELHFTWQSATPMPYSISLSVNDVSAIGKPSINITRKGNVPTKKQVFQIILPCTGKVSAEVDVNIYINITMSPSSNVTQLTLKRKKICLKGYPQINWVDQDERSVTTDTAAIINSSKSSLYIGGISAILVILFFGFVSLMCYVRSHKAANPDSNSSYGGATSHLSIGKTGQTYLSVDTPTHITHKANSQCSSFTKLTATPSSAHRPLLTNGMNTTALTTQQNSAHFHQLNSRPYQISLYSPQQRAHQLNPAPRSIQSNVYSKQNQHVYAPLLPQSKELSLNEQIINLALERKNILLKEKLQSGTFAQIYSGLYFDNDDGTLENNYECIENDDSFTTDNDEYDDGVDEESSGNVEENDGGNPTNDLERTRRSKREPVRTGRRRRNEKTRRKAIEEQILVKTITDQASRMQVTLFLSEGMSFVNCQHVNILSVIGTCIDEPFRPLLIYPHMNSGILKLFLLKCKFSSEGQLYTLSTRDLVLIALQMIDGIIYLHNKNILHKDLATRNCMLSIQNEFNMNGGIGAGTGDDRPLSEPNSYRSYLVKITDPALSRDLFPNDYHCLGDNENRPIKWMSIESLTRKEFTEASDAWSFGVTLWELLTLGQQPYAEIDPFEMEAFLRDGYRLYHPVNCPDNLYDIMVCCWNSNPTERPTFPQLFDFLQDFYTALGKYI